jgi:DNA-binding MarR family transcriptional regulator
MQRAYAPLLRPLGLTYASYLVLLVLFEGDGLAVGEIGRRLFLDSGTLTPVLRRMEGLGIVTRRRSPDDEREVHISLTLAGQRLESKLDEIRAALACRMALPVSALEALRGQLHDLRSRVAAEETGAA